MKRLEQELRASFGARVKSGALLAELTSFRIGGPADLLLTVESEDELRAAMAAAWGAHVPAFCLGSGTNLLVSDRGVRGLVVRLGEGFARLEFDGVRVRAGAAVRFGHLVEEAIERGLKGLEFGEGIPGSVGGGLVMNAGAFGGEIARVVRIVHGVNERGEPLALSGGDVRFSYRRAELPPHFVITRVDFELEPGDREALRARVAEIHEKRAARQPRTLPNAGSIFKNPPGNFAGRLLECAGLKGMRMGGAAFSKEHANFIVNLGGACAEDVRALIELAQNRVKERSGVALEPEVRLVGDW
jgi:UDP-N-acetylmuramate dehydrogenase